MISKSTNYLTKMQQEHKLFFDDHETYKKHVNSISEMFSFTGTDKLMTEYLPVAFAGRYSKKGSIVMFGLNPGFNEEMNPIEEKGHGTTWEDYCKLRSNLYQLFKKLNHPSPYCKILFKLFSNLYDTHDNQWDFFHDNVVNLNLIPYHSKTLSMPAKFTKTQLAYLKESYFSQLEFAQTIQPRLYIFNGNPWYRLLIENNIINDFEKIQITPKFNIYFFKIGSVTAILFDKFFTSHFFGLTDHHRTEIIPQLINERIK